MSTGSTVLIVAGVGVAILIGYELLKPAPVNNNMPVNSSSSNSPNIWGQLLAGGVQGLVMGIGANQRASDIAANNVNAARGGAQWNVNGSPFQPQTDLHPAV